MTKLTYSFFLFCLWVSYQYLTWWQTQPRYHLYLQDSSFIFLSAEHISKAWEGKCLEKYVLLCPRGPPPQAAGDQLVISRWKVPFLTVYSAKNFGSWLDFSSESQDNRESCSMQENSPIILFFQKENRFPAGHSLIKTLPSLPQQSHIQSQVFRPARYTDLPESTRSSKACPTAELLSFPHIPLEPVWNNAILLLNCCCCTNGTPE